MQEIKDTLDKIFNKLETIDEKQATMAEVQVKHEENLREHMRRTEILESEFAPVSKHVQQVRGAAKLLAALIPVAGLIIAWLALK